MGIAWSFCSDAMKNLDFSSHEALGQTSGLYRHTVHTRRHMKMSIQHTKHMGDGEGEASPDAGKHKHNMYMLASRQCHGIRASKLNDVTLLPNKIAKYQFYTYNTHYSCMYMREHTYIHIHIYIYTYICIYIYMYQHMCLHSMYIYKYMCGMRIYICVYIHE